MDTRYRANRSHRCLLVAAVASIAIAALLGLFSAPLIRFFLQNPPMNSVILAVFAVGVGLVFLHLLRLAREERLANLTFRRTFVEERDGWQPDQLAERLPRSAVRERISQAKSLGARGGPAHEEALAEIAEAEEATRAAVVRYLVGILVFLGLIGTFAGILMTVEGVRGILAQLELDPYEDMQVFLRKLREDLGTPLQGMATAFSTSLFGLGASVILGFLGLQLTRAQELFLAKMNDLTMIWLFPAFHVGEVAHPTAHAAPQGAPLQAGELRSLEAGARYLEAGARALHDDVASLQETVARTESLHGELLQAVRALTEAVGRGASATARLEESARQGREEELRLLGEQVRHGRAVGELDARMRELEERLAEAVAVLREGASDGAERDRSLRAALEREAKTLAHQISSSLSELTDLEDAAAREICRRLSDGLGRVEAAVGDLASRWGAAPPRRRSGGAPAPPEPDGDAEERRGPGSSGRES